MERRKDLPTFTQQEQDPESLPFSLHEMMVPGAKVAPVGTKRSRYLGRRNTFIRKDSPTGVEEQCLKLS